LQKEAAGLIDRAGRRKTFNEHGDRLLSAHPESADEIRLRIDQLNEKWATLEQALSVNVRGNMFRRREPSWRQDEDDCTGTRA
jgi:hypothetical protein